MIKRQRKHAQYLGEGADGRKRYRVTISDRSIKLLYKRQTAPIIIQGVWYILTPYNKEAQSKLAIKIAKAEQRLEELRRLKLGKPKLARKSWMSKLTPEQKKAHMEKMRKARKPKGAA